MPIGTVSTYAIFQTTLNDVGKVINDLNTEQGQLSSGKNSSDFAGMASQAQQFLSLDASITRSDQFVSDNQVVSTRIESTNSVLSQIITTATSLQNLIAERRSGVGDNSAFGLQVQGMWQSLVQELNTTVNGQYIFSGTRTDTPAVDSANFPKLAVDGVPDDGYYLGSQQDMTMRADDNVLITYNVRADNPGLQKIFAALAMAKTGDQSNSDDELKQAETFVQDGLKEVIAAQATVNANKVAINNINTNHSTLKLYWQGVQQSIGNTDVVSVSTQVAINQGILQAAFQAFAKITSLRLSDYLK